MKFYRILALIERDMRKFFRTPALMMSPMIFPLMQLVVLGYAFGGKIKEAMVPVVDQSHSVKSHRVREMFGGIGAGPETFQVVEYDSLPCALDDLRAAMLRGVIQIPYGFSRRYYKHDRPRIAFTEDNTDQFMSSSLLERIQQIIDELNTPAVQPRLTGQVELNVVETYPCIEYIKYLLAGSTAMVIFIVAMMGGGITLIDDKARGLREGCLTMPIHKTELVMGLIGSVALKGIMAGMVLTIIGGLIAGIPRLWDPIRLFYLAVVVLAASVAMIGFMFLIMVRVDDPVVPRAVFGVLNTLLFSPSGAVFQSRGSRGRFAGSRSSIGSHIPCLHSGTSPLKIQALKGFTWTC